MVSKRVPKPSRKAAQRGRVPPPPPPQPLPGDVNWRFHHLNPRLQPQEIQGDLDAMLMLAERYEELRAIAAERAAEEAEAAAAAGGHSGGGSEAMETEEPEQQPAVAAGVGAAPLGAARAGPPVVNSIPAGAGTAHVTLVGSPGTKAGLAAAPVQQPIMQQAAVRV